MKLFNDDCLSALNQIPDQSIDLILTDPPYKVTACGWDMIIPLKPMWKQLERVIKPKGAICLFGTNPYAAKVICSNLPLFKYDWVWNKSNRTDFIRAKLKPMGGHELVMVFSKSSVANGAKELMNYYPQGLKPCNRKVSNINAGGKGLWDGRNMVVDNTMIVNDYYIQEWEGYPSTQLNYRTDSDKIHPTQKPVRLLRYLIETYSLEGETVLDFTMGSGSTGVACVTVNREFIGIEKDKTIYNKAHVRINKALRDPIAQLKSEIEEIERPIMIPVNIQTLYARYHDKPHDQIPDHILSKLKKYNLV